MNDRAAIVLATPHRRHDGLETILREQHDFHVVRVRTPEELSAAALAQINPSHVFFAHWSTLIPADIYTRFECVVFHMTDVPFGRGGSPLQNLIARGIYETRLSALRCEAEVDAGPVYLKRPLSLYGSAEEILMRAADAMAPMISEIVTHRLAPVPQEGAVTRFKRRRPQDGDLAGVATLMQVHDVIRMLDADGYPPAFLEIGDLRFEFGRSRLEPDEVTADVRITLSAKGRS
jgi:methionyl-tRNA formyltransferase